ncbi:MAG: outer membrane protein assembly factor BamD [Gammaproteobacteria bacterium RIFCSPHIGHO2_02_FULL_39_13]|nr:MAG: outer membrane protein assembly factor BamD [Gammaproteobacteria bacterium RIFCSPHIGHO2_02_FULL_39_13]OGT49285.1 MAG: outer membrane protein assembly factor BamD [Gammaproteobacteria bacterium RIFCSPHIGHO2_12_FULL_39_24]
MKKLLLLCCLVVVLCGCSSNSLQDSFKAYRNKTASELYHTSKKDLLDGHYHRAVKQLEALNALYPFGAYAEQGLINLVFAYYKDDEADEALATADRYLALYPRGSYSDYAYYMKGVIAFRQGFSWLQRKAGVNPAPRDLTNLKQAYLSFNELVQQFPTSSYVPDAIARMRYIRNLFAEKEVGIAQFYFDQKAYVAAANRASTVLEHYDRSPSVIPALVIMVKSYRQLGLTHRANNTMKIFQASYPHSRALKALR